ncbi:MAG: type II toxin-antitoxin system RelE family toxin [Trueperaceae bacterium]
MSLILMAFATSRAKKNRLRVGDFQIIYSVDKKEKVIDLIYVRNRKDAYKG